MRFALGEVFGGNKGKGVTASTLDRESYQVGQLVEDKGIYIGTIQLPKRDFGIFRQERLSCKPPKMDLWRSPQGLSAKTNGPQTWVKSVKEVANLRQCSGHDGLPLKHRPIEARDMSYEENLYRYFQALANGDAKSGWFMPLHEMFNGKTPIAYDCYWNPNNLHAHNDKIPEEYKIPLNLGCWVANENQWGNNWKNLIEFRSDIRKYGYPLMSLENSGKHEVYPVRVELAA